jgi:hypothetical protein
MRGGVVGLTSNTILCQKWNRCQVCERADLKPVDLLRLSFRIAQFSIGFEFLSGSVTAAAQVEVSKLAIRKLATTEPEESSEAVSRTHSAAATRRPGPALSPNTTSSAE